MKKKEEKLQTQISRYLRLQYPHVMFTSSPSGVRLNMGQARTMLSQQNPRKGWPDLMIMQIAKKDVKVFAGLFIELKQEGYELFKQDGTLRKNEHIECQNEVHQKLRERGYFAVFSVGFEETKKLIDWYLSDGDVDNT